MDQIFASGDELIGIRKPNRECSDKIALMAKADPQNSIVIGDSYEQDHVGSVRAGWKSIWVNPIIEIDQSVWYVSTPLEFF